MLGIQSCFLLMHKIWSLDVSLTKTTLFLYSTPKQKRVHLIFWMKKEKFRFRALLIRNLLRTPEVVFKGVLKREKTKEEVIPRVQLFNTVRFRTNRTSPVSYYDYDFRAFWNKGCSAVKYASARSRLAWSGVSLKIRFNSDPTP